MGYQGFSPVWVRISGGWRGWREGMGDFPDITEAGAAAGERSGSGAGNTGAASEHRFRRLVGRRLSHAVIGRHQPRRGSAPSPRMDATPSAMDLLHSVSRGRPRCQPRAEIPKPVGLGFPRAGWRHDEPLPIKNPKSTFINHQSISSG